jgi:hypothetical protein
MEQCGMVLNLHGECPSDHEKNITILNAECKSSNCRSISSFFGCLASRLLLRYVLRVNGS